MTDAFGLSHPDDSPIVAASNAYSGKNSAAARRLRVKLQRRDRYGRWVEMGGVLSFKVRVNGEVQTKIGRAVGGSERDGYIRVVIPEGQGIRPGTYHISEKVSRTAKAMLGEDYLEEKGVRVDSNGNSIGEVLDRDIEDVKDLFREDTSDLDRAMLDGVLSDDEKSALEKSRQASPTHKSYNVVDESGKRVDEDEVGGLDFTDIADSRNWRLRKNRDGSIKSGKYLSPDKKLRAEIYQTESGKTYMKVSYPTDKNLIENEEVGALTEDDLLGDSRNLSTGYGRALDSVDKTVKGAKAVLPAPDKEEQKKIDAERKAMEDLVKASPVRESYAMPELYMAEATDDELFARLKSLEERDTNNDSLFLKDGEIRNLRAERESVIIDDIRRELKSRGLAIPKSVKPAKRPLKKPAKPSEQPDNWLSAPSLRVGDQIVDADGKRKKIASITPEPDGTRALIKFADGSERMYEGEELVQIAGKNVIKEDVPVEPVAPKFPDANRSNVYDNAAKALGITPEELKADRRIFDAVEHTSDLIDKREADALDDFMGEDGTTRLYSSLTDAIAKHYALTKNGELYQPEPLGRDNKDLLEKARAGGATINPLSRRNRLQGWAVAVRGNNDEIIDTVALEDGIGDLLMNDYVNRNIDKFGGNKYLGLWHDKKSHELVYDVSEVFKEDNVEEATKAGKDRNQKAIFNLKTWDEIETGGTGDNGRARKERESARLGGDKSRGVEEPEPERADSAPEERTPVSDSGVDAARAEDEEGLREHLRELPSFLRDNLLELLPTGIYESDKKSIAENIDRLENSLDKGSSAITQALKALSRSLAKAEKKQDEKDADNREVADLLDETIMQVSLAHNFAKSITVAPSAPGQPEGKLTQPGSASSRRISPSSDGSEFAPTPRMARDSGGGTEDPISDLSDIVDDTDPEIVRQLRAMDLAVDYDSLSDSQKNTYNNLKTFQENAVRALTIAAVSDNMEKYKRQRTIALSVTRAYNGFITAINTGNPREDYISTGSMENRTRNLTFIEDSITTKTGRDTRTKIIDKAKAIFVARDGSVYELSMDRYNSDIEARKLDASGNYVRLPSGTERAATLNHLGGGDDGFHTESEAYLDPYSPNSDKIRPVSPGMIRTEDSLQSSGLAGALYAFLGYVHNQNGRGFMHSAYLLRMGNLASKLVNKNLKYHHPAQKEKALTVINPNSDIIQSMSDAGWFDRSYRAFTTLTYYPSDHSSLDIPGKMTFQNFLKPLDGSLAGGDNIGPLWNMDKSIHELADELGVAAMELPDVANYFKDYLDGGKKDWELINIQGTLLDTAFLGGATKEDALSKLRNLKKAVDVISADVSLGSSIRRISGGLSESLDDLIPAIDARSFDDSTRVERPKDMDFNAFSKVNSDPYTAKNGYEPFRTDFIMPEGVPPIDSSDSYMPKRVYPAEWINSDTPAPSSWSDEGGTLELQTEERLVDALRQSIRNKSDLAVMSFDGVDRNIQARSIYDAIRRKSLDHNMILAKLYDEVLGGDENQRRLEEFRRTAPSIKSEAAELIESVGIVIPPADFEFGGMYDEDAHRLSAGSAIFDDEVTGEGFGLQLSKLSENENLQTPSYMSLDRNPYVSVDEADDWSRLGTSDNPRIIARNFSRSGLSQGLVSAVKRNSSYVNLQFANGTERSISILAIRDALQHQGVDTNALLKSAGAKRVREYIRSLNVADNGERVTNTFQVGANPGFLRTNTYANPETESNGRATVIIDDPNGTSFDSLGSGSKVIGLTRLDTTTDPLRPYAVVWFGKKDAVALSRFNVEDHESKVVERYETRAEADAVLGDLARDDMFFVDQIMPGSGALPPLKITKQIPSTLPMVERRLGSKTTSYQIGIIDPKVVHFSDNRGVLGEGGKDDLFRDDNGNILATVTASEDGQFQAKVDSLTETFTNRDMALWWAGDELARKLEANVNFFDNSRVPAERPKNFLSGYEESETLTTDLTLSTYGVLSYNEGAILRKIKVTGQRARASAYRRAAPDYKLVSISVTDPNNEAVNKFDLQINRTGRSEWYLTASGGEIAPGEPKRVYKIFSTPEVALEEARKLSKDRLGKDMIPDFSDIGYKSSPSTRTIDDILAHSSTVIDSTGATEVSALGGVNGAKKVKLSDGRIFKRKGGGITSGPDATREAENKRRVDAEVFAHAVYNFAGIQATNAQKGKNGSESVIMDPWVNSDSRRNWMQTTERSGSGTQIGEDVQRGFVIDALFDNRDIATNSGNIIVGTDGRAYRCDMGGAGLFKAGGDRAVRATTFQPDRGESSVDYFMGNYMDWRSSTIYKGLSEEKRKQFAIDHLVPLTDEALDKLGVLIENEEDRKKTLDILKARRDGILRKLGIDIEEERRKRAGSSAAEPEPESEDVVEVPDTSEETIDEPILLEEPVPSGPKRVKMSDRLPLKRTPDGVYYPERHSDLFPYTQKIRNGEIVPEELPFAFKQPIPVIDAGGFYMSTPPSYVDANGIYRTSAFGTFNTFIRRKNADGSYSILGFGRGIGDREVLGGLIEDRGAYSHDADAEHLRQVLDSKTHGLESKTPVTHEVELAPGYKSRVSIYDLSEDEARDLNLANERLLSDDDGGKYRNREWMSQSDFLDRISDPEWSANPDNLQGLRAIFSLPTGPTPISKPLGVPRSDDEDIEVGTIEWSRTSEVLGKSYTVSKLTNGTYSINDSSGKTIAEVRPAKGLYKFEAYILPNNIGTPGNPGARLAFFDNDRQATAWAGDLATEIIGGDKNLFNELGVGEVDLGPISPVVHKGGHLDKATEDQIATLTRLVNTKEMVGATRAQYREHLRKPNLVKGEVGSLIRQLSRTPDRSDDVTASERDGESVTPSKPTDGGIVPPKGPSGDEDMTTSPFIRKKASELAPGDKIVNAKGEYIGKVAITYVDKENGKVTVAMIDKTGASVNLEEALMDDSYLVDPRVPAAVAVPEGKDKEEGAGGAGGGDTTALPGGLRAFRARSSYIIDQVKTAYPTAVQLPNGDLVIAEREYTERSRLRRTFKYQVVVHRLPNERFVAYAREVLLKPDGSIDPDYTPRAGRVTPQTHSPLALLNDIPPLLNGEGPEQGILKRNPRQWLSNSGDLQNEVVNPATGQLLPETLSPRVGEKFIGDTGIKTTGDGVKDALIGYIAELVDRGVLDRDIISRMTSGRQTALNKEQVIDLVERIEANRNFPGVNAIPYVARDNASIVRIGDKVRHYSPSGRIKEGVVMDRIQLVINRKPSGQYEYTDKVWVQFPGRAGWTEITTRNLEILKRKDGSDPLPAIDAETKRPISPIPPAAPETDRTPIPTRDGSGTSEASDEFLNGLDEFGDAHVNAMNGGHSKYGLPEGYKASVREGGGMQVTQDSGSTLGLFAPNPDGTVSVYFTYPGFVGINKSKTVATKTEAMRLVAEAMKIDAGIIPAPTNVHKKGEAVSVDDVYDYTGAEDSSGVVHQITRTGLSTTFSNPATGEKHPISVSNNLDGTWKVTGISGIGETLYSPSSRQEAEAVAISALSRGDSAPSVPADVGLTHRRGDTIDMAKAGSYTKVESADGRMHNVNRQAIETTFTDVDTGEVHDISVKRAAGGKWRVVSSSARLETVHGSRDEAEAYAITRINSGARPSEWLDGRVSPAPDLEDFDAAVKSLDGMIELTNWHAELMNRDDAPEEFKVPEGYKVTIRSGESMTIEHLDRPTDNLRVEVIRRPDLSWEVQTRRPGGFAVTIPPIYKNRVAPNPIEAIKMANSDLKNARAGAPHDGMKLEDRMADLTNNDRFLEDMHTYLFTDTSLPTELRNRYKLPEGYSAVRRTSSGGYGSVFITKKNADGVTDPDSPIAEISLVRDGKRTITVWANDSDRMASRPVFEGRTALDPEHAIAMVSSDLRSAIQGRPARDIKQYKDLGSAPAPAPASPEAPATPSVPAGAPALPEGYTVRGGEGDAPTILRSNDMSKPYMRIEKSTDENGNVIFKGKAWNNGKDALDDLSPAEEKDFTDREKAMKWATRRAEDPSRIGKPDEPETKWDTDADGREVLTVTGIEGSDDDSNPAALITDVPGVGVLGAVYNKKSGIGGTPYEVRTFRSRDEAKEWANGLINGELEKFKNGEESDLFKNSKDSEGMPEPITRDFLRPYLDDPIIKPDTPTSLVAKDILKDQDRYDPEKTTGEALWFDALALKERLRREADSVDFSPMVTEAADLRNFKEQWRDFKYQQIENFVEYNNERVKKLLAIRSRAYQDGVFNEALHKELMANFTFAQNRVRDRMERAKVAKNIKIEDLFTMINAPTPEERRLKNQFETRTTGGYAAFRDDPKWGMRRRRAEWRFGNVSLTATDDMRTKYGFPLNNGVNGIGEVTDFDGPEDVVGYRNVTAAVRRNVDSALNSGMKSETAYQYGDIILVMKDSVKNRTTVTFRDSLDAPVTAMPMLGFTDEQMWNAGWGDKIKINNDGGIENYGGSYFEIQMNGRIGLEEVEAIYVNSETQKREVESKLRAIGIGIPVQIKSRR